MEIFFTWERGCKDVFNTTVFVTAPQCKDHNAAGGSASENNLDVKTSLVFKRLKTHLSQSMFHIHNISIGKGITTIFR